MKVLAVGPRSFQDWARNLGDIGTWDLAVAETVSDVEDHVLTGTFQAILIDVDATVSDWKDYAACLRQLRTAYVTIGFHKEHAFVFEEFFFAHGLHSLHYRYEHMRLTLMRCNALMRLAQGLKSPEIAIGDVTLNLDTQAVTGCGRALHFSYREYQLIELLFLNPEQVITTERFLNQIYGLDDAPGPKMFDVLICKIRRKLRDAGIQDEIIQTHRGKGYSANQPRPQSLRFVT